MFNSKKCSRSFCLLVNPRVLKKRGTAVYNPYEVETISIDSGKVLSKRD